MKTSLATTMKIIGFAGRKWSGKDTSADHLVRKHGFVQYAFAAPLKNFCRDIFDLDHDQLYGSKREEVDTRYDLTPRQLLQKFGSDFLRDMIDKDFWIKFFVRWANQQTKPIVVSDVRFQNELDIIRSLGGRVVRIDRKDGHGSNDPHASECVDSLKNVDVVIHNYDLDTLYRDLDAVHGLFEHKFGDDASPPAGSGDDPEGSNKKNSLHS